MTTDPKRGNELLAKLFVMKNLPCAPDPAPETDPIQPPEPVDDMTPEERAKQIRNSAGLAPRSRSEHHR